MTEAILRFVQVTRRMPAHAAPEAVLRSMCANLTRKWMKLGLTQVGLGKPSP